MSMLEAAEPRQTALPPADQALAEGVLASQRRALAKAITLIESSRPDHQERAHRLLERLLPETGKAIRIGISGVPGAGKSTFIEALGTWLIDRGHRLAVLAVDPSSSVSGGSILGDKTRMENLCQREEAFIRPSPSSGSLGGVAEKSREAMLLCEAAGFDVIIVETVGVGQSETTVAGMVDMFCLLQLPNAGDDLQAIKKGIVELRIGGVNKADIDPRAAQVVRAQWAMPGICAAHVFPIGSPVHPVGLHKEGIGRFGKVEAYQAALDPAGFRGSPSRQSLMVWSLSTPFAAIFRNPTGGAPDLTEPHNAVAEDAPRRPQLYKLLADLHT